jgi:hypothetical protein
MQSKADWNEVLKAPGLMSEMDPTLGWYDSSSNGAATLPSWIRRGETDPAHVFNIPPGRLRFLADHRFSPGGLIGLVDKRRPWQSKHREYRTVALPSKNWGQSVSQTLSGVGVCTLPTFRSGRFVRAGVSKNILIPPTQRDRIETGIEGSGLVREVRDLPSVTVPFLIAKIEDVIINIRCDHQELILSRPGFGFAQGLGKDR